VPRVTASQYVMSTSMPTQIDASGGTRAAMPLPSRISPSVAVVAISGSRLRSTFSPTML
jgi:hypothetical protein